MTFVIFVGLFVLCTFFSWIAFLIADEATDGFIPACLAILFGLGALIFLVCAFADFGNRFDRIINALEHNNKVVCEQACVEEVSHE